MRYLLGFLALLLLASPASAGLSRAELSSVAAAPPPGARLDPNLAARDVTGKWRSVGELLAGHPIFFSFIDYTCNTLCGTDLELLSAGIQNAHLDPADYRIVVFGLDPKDTAKDAFTMARKEIPAALLSRAVLLRPDAATVGRAARALGFHYRYDPAADQFAHPAAVYVIGSDGGVRGVLSPFALTVTDMKVVLAAAKPALSLYDRVRLLCYCYDPQTGIYSLRIAWILRGACLATLLTLGLAVFVFAKRARAAA
ncbi:MAG TPA: SCO family protein [Rhizomicrobium sp.]|jgi:protein SCO1/2